jgi:hypothetical protein
MMDWLLAIILDYAESIENRFGFSPQKIFLTHAESRKNRFGL